MNEKIEFEIILDKMTTTLDSDGLAAYQLGDWFVQEWLGKKLTLDFSAGEKVCLFCEKPVKKLYAQGSCYPCSISRPDCDWCVLSPNTCHFYKGSCRDEKWAEKNCQIPHAIYLSFTSDLKVGLTKGYNLHSRWIDQGAIFGLKIMDAPRRYTAGLMEELAKSVVSDKTEFRRMLKEDFPVDPEPSWLYEMRAKLPFSTFLPDEKVQRIHYPEVKGGMPVLKKVNSFNLDKINKIEGRLMKIKGQYLILDTGVINIRSHAGYKIKGRMNS